MNALSDATTRTESTATAALPLSIIIPTLDEEHSLAGLLSDLGGLGVPHEVIVVDGGSIDRTRSVAQQRGARVITTRAGRGHQLATGAKAAQGELLCFLHADVRLPGRTREAIAEEALSPIPGAVVFTLRINATGARYRMVERLANWRTRVLGLPYGDQGLLVRRADYDAVGGYEDIRVMEDVAIVRALRRHAVVRLLGENMLVSPRRWQREGVLRRSMRNLVLVTLYLMGFPPNWLARFYRPSGDTTRRTPVNGR